MRSFDALLKSHINSDFIYYNYYMVKKFERNILKSCKTINLQRQRYRRGRRGSNKNIEKFQFISMICKSRSLLTINFCLYLFLSLIDVSQIQIQLQREKERRKLKEKEKQPFLTSSSPVEGQNHHPPPTTTEKTSRNFRRRSLDFFSSGQARLIISNFNA